MSASVILLLVCISLVMYTYIGYALLIYLLNRISKKPEGKYTKEPAEWPAITVIIPAYNEAAVLPQKIANTLSADYPKHLISIFIITDGSNDGSESLKFTDPRITHLHQPVRQGKSAAINQGVALANTEIIFITDANTMIHPLALKTMTARYQKTNVGGVSGEKRIQLNHEESSVGGEGFYWKYESFLKREGARFYTVVGAAGELFSFKKSLFKPLPNDTILDDFVLSMEIVKQGYVIDYEPRAYAIENPSKHIADEFKRKVRISSGVWQALGRLHFLFNPFFNFRLFFQFISHRFLRWTLAPMAMIAILVISIAEVQQPVFYILLVLQVIFYALAFTGFLLKNTKLRWPLIFIPFYYCMMNAAVFAGVWAYFRGRHSVLWEKASR
jgi:biofilm PGA synthesis N-glycosyltransferase PgaC